ncbi:MAG: hypothetical protein ACREH3_13880, partial [Geminicoccales bacterium]
MPTSQEVSEAQSITGSTFARAFVGAIGRGAKHLAFVPPKIDTLAEIRVHEGDLYRFMAFGRTKNTLGPLLDSPASVIIKGRPFPVSATALAPGFTRENREAQLLALDGKFSLLAQIDDGAFIAATDLIGAGGLFYAYRRSDETLYVATHLGFLLSIIGDRPEYDQTGVAAMIMARSCVGGITPLRDVFLLTAGRFLNVAVDHNGRVDFSVEVYGSLSAELAAPSESRASPETLHEQFGELLLQSMTRE